MRSARHRSTSTSPGGASSKCRRSRVTLPHPPDDGHGRVVEGANQGRDDIAGQLDVGVEDDDDRSARTSDPDVHGGGRTESVAVRTISIASRGLRRRCARSISSERRILVGPGRSTTITTDVPTGAVSSRRRSLVRVARGRRSRQERPWRARTPDHRAATGRSSSTRTGSDRPPATSGGLAGESAKSVPRSTTFHPAASISSLSRSASPQSRPARARPLSRVPPRARRPGCGSGSQERAQPIGNDVSHVARSAERGHHSGRVLRGNVERVDDPCEGKYVAAVIERHAGRGEPRSEIGVREDLVRHGDRIAGLDRSRPGTRPPKGMGAVIEPSDQSRKTGPISPTMTSSGVRSPWSRLSGTELAASAATGRHEVPFAGPQRSRPRRQTDRTHGRLREGRRHRANPEPAPPGERWARRPRLRSSVPAGPRREPAAAPPCGPRSPSTQPVPPRRPATAPST